MSENKIPAPLIIREKAVAILELLINANTLAAIIIATTIQRIIIVGSAFLIAVL